MARTATYDRDEVLGRATDVFWEHGYCDTSVSRLVKATRLQPGSLYAAFASKEGLFLAVIDRYAERSRARMRAVLEAAPDPLQGIESLLRGLAGSDAAAARRGCLLVNSVLERGRTDPAIQQRLRSHLEQTEVLLRDALLAAQRQGQLADDKPPAALAKFLITTVWGLRVLGGIGGDAAQAQQVVDQALAVLR